MSKRPDVNACVFCGDNCQCGVKPKKAAVPRPRKPKDEEVIVTTPKPSAIEEMRVAHQAFQLDDRRRAASQPRPQAMNELNEADAVTMQALRNLQTAFTIDGPDLARFRPYLDKPPTITERASAWRMQRRGSG